jgi:hypothetical protein
MLRKAADENCGKKLNAACTDKLFQFLDRWYE